MATLAACAVLPGFGEISYRVFAKGFMNKGYMSFYSKVDFYLNAHSAHVKQHFKEKAVVSPYNHSTENRLMPLLAELFTQSGNFSVHGIGNDGAHLR